jgi:3-hydroxy-3-methylglutaryl CoA synthase
MSQVGIEKINIYGSSLFMAQAELAEARGKDSKVYTQDYLIKYRSLNPLYEDIVTMAVNAAAPMLTPEDKEQIGLLIFATETSLDFSKPASIWVHQALGLPPNIKNYEIKFACFSGVAALDCALDWVEAGTHRGKKALILAADFSREHFHQTEEFIGGGGAAAILVSDTPKVIAYERLKSGVWTNNEYDFFRPTARLELINNELSLFSYLGALEGAYRHYLDNAGSVIDFDEYFNYLIYHMPFPGMAFQAHRTLLNLDKKRGREEILTSFAEKVRPSLRYAFQVGSTYSTSNFIGLCGLINEKSDQLQDGDRIGFFSYGSGAIGQFYSGLLLPEAVDTLAAQNLDREFSSRRRISFEEYEMIEKMREETVEVANFTPPLDLPSGWYDTYYRGQHRLILKQVSGYQRDYGWS